jgi:hypothetical protein
MRRSVKLAFLVAAVACLFALAASSAYASTEEYSFVAERYPVELEAITHDDGFEVTGGVGVCENATYTTGSIAGPTASLSVSATYSGCKGEIAGKIYKASVDMNGCTYNFHHFVFESHQTVAGKVSVECQPGHEIEVKIPELNASCVGRIPAQTELPGTTYTLATSATGWPTIDAAAALTDVEYSSEDCPGIAKSSREAGAKPGRFEEGELSGEGRQIKLTGAPLEAEIKGYEAGAAHEEANEIGVDGRIDHAIASGGGQIAGTVTSALAAPIEGIGVTVFGASQANPGFYGSTTTNADGEYILSGLPGGEYEVEFSTVHGSALDYATQYYNGTESFSQAEAVTVTAGETTGEVNAELQLQSAQPPGQITGTVTSAVTKAPLEGAEVEIVEAATERFVARRSTNAQGQYTVPGLAPGEYKVQFSDEPNWVHQYYNHKSSFATAEAVEVSSGATTAGIDAELQKSGQITGQVTSEASGQGIEIIEVVVYEAGAQGKKVAETQTHGGGDYTVPDLAPGEYVVEFYSGVPGSNEKNYAKQYYSGQSSRSTAQPVKVSEGETRSGIDAKLQSGGQISGTVTNALKEPVGGVAVVVYDSEGSEEHASYTDSNGEYTVPGLASGKDEVEFIGAQYVTQYYKDASSLADASPVTVKAGHEETTSEINAELTAAAAPEKVKSPVVKGTVAVGQTLTCSSAWTGTPTPEEFTYRWLKNGVTEIAGATKETYNVTSVDERHALACEVTAKNSAGEKSAQSPVTQMVSVIKPVNTTRPVISGTAAVGQTLTCSHGTWESFPAGYTYKWLREGAEIPGALSNTYAVGVADESHSISCEVTATNGAGPSSPELSANSDSVPMQSSLPTNTVSPEVAVRGGGPALLGKILSCSSGTWTGTPTPTFTYRWLRDGVAIGGEQSSVYVVVAADEGHSIFCEVTATNTAGATSAVSANSIAIREEARERREAEEAAAKNHPGETPAKKQEEEAKIAIAGSVSLTGSIVSVQSAGKASVKLTCAGTATCTGRLTLVVSVKGKHGKKAKAETIGTAAFSIPAGRTGVVTITLTAAGRALLKAAHGKLNASLTVLKSSPAPASTQHKTITLVQKTATKAKKQKR